MISLDRKTVSEISKDLAGRVARLRKRQKMSQETLAAKSGVSFGSIKRFERTGEISLSSLVKIAIALEVDDEIDKLFTEVPFDSIEEILNEQA